jgi:hypothetical protein
MVLSYADSDKVLLMFGRIIRQEGLPPLPKSG